MVDRENLRIGDLGFFFVLASATIEVGILEIPRTLAVAVGRDMWLVPIVMYPVLLLSLLAFCALGKRFPDQTVFEYGPTLLGDWLTQALFVVLILFWLLLTGRMIREFSDVVELTLLDLTPIEVVMATMLVGAGYLARHGVVPLARCATITFLFTVPIGLVITGLTFVGTEPLTSMRPILANGAWDVLKQGILRLGTVEQISALFVLFPFLGQPAKAFRTGAIALAVVMVSVLLVAMATLSVFGPVELMQVRLPALTAVHTIEQPFVFLERLSSFYVATWLAQVFLTTAFMVWLISTGLQRWLRLQSSAGLVVPLLPIIYLIALSPSSVETVNQLSHGITSYGVLIQLPLPIILYVIAVIRKIGHERSRSGRSGV